MENLAFSDKHKNFFRENIRKFFLWTWKTGFSGKYKTFFFRQKISSFKRAQKGFFRLKVVFFLASIRNFCLGWKICFGGICLPECDRSVYYRLLLCVKGEVVTFWNFSFKSKFNISVSKVKEIWTKSNDSATTDNYKLVITRSWKVCLFWQIFYSFLLF